MALTNPERQKLHHERIKQKLADAATSKRYVTDAAPSSVLVEKLDVLFEQLFAEGLKNIATMSPPTVAYLALQIERLLVEHGVMPESRRSTDPQAHAKSLKARQTRRDKKE